MSSLPTIYIGYDPKEKTYCDVLEYSINKYTSGPVNIVRLTQDSVRRSGLYWRAGTIKEGQQVDTFDNKPFSTEFSFTRFLVPFLNVHQGLALFVDCDMYFRDDVMKLFNMFSDRNFSVACVHHNYVPKDTYKMDNQLQQSYYRKNWSSFMLWNCSSPELNELTVADVNVKNGSWLHSLYWADKVSQLAEEWNWLDGHSSESIDPKCVHFTTGGPLFRGWDGKREIDNHYAKEWTKLYKEMSEQNG
jgi:hypothetical protein